MRSASASDARRDRHSSFASNAPTAASRSTQDEAAERDAERTLRHLCALCGVDSVAEVVAPFLATHRDTLATASAAMLQVRTAAAFHSYVCRRAHTVSSNNLTGLYFLALNSALTCSTHTSSAAVASTRTCCLTWRACTSRQLMCSRAHSAMMWMATTTRIVMTTRTVFLVTARVVLCALVRHRRRMHAQTRRRVALAVHRRR